MSANSTAGDFIDLYGDFEIDPFWEAYGVKSTGYVIPSFEDMIQRQIDVFRSSSVFGSTLSIDPSSPEGQMIYNEAKDKYSLLLQGMGTYNSFGFNASGNALDRTLQYIGTQRNDNSYSQVTVVFTTEDGVTPVTLEKGFQISNTNGDIFEITDKITFTSTESVSAIAQETGPVDVSAGKVTTIITARGNLASVNNPTDGTTGTSVESDAEARQRGIQSTESRSVSTLSGVISQIKNVQGVLQVKAFENKSSVTVGFVTPHATRLVVRGGSDSEIGNVLYMNEVPGITYCGDSTHTVTHTVTEADGVVTAVYFDRPEEISIYVRVPISTRFFDDAIAQRIVDYSVNTSYGFNIGEKITGNKLYQPAYEILQENGADNGNKIGEIQVSLNGTDWFNEISIDEDAIGVFSKTDISFSTIGV